jgi:hypothetical protein
MSLRRFQIFRESVAALVGCCLMVAPSLETGAQTTRKPETPYEIRAYFLINFALYTEWPKEAFAETNSPFVFGILGKDPFEKDLDIVKDSLVRGRKLLIKHCSGIKEAEGCHLLYISSTEEHRLGEIFKSLGNSSILTVGEMDGFLDKGGMLNFIVKKKTRPGYGNLGYEVNQAAADKARLRINSYLLAKAGKE